MNWTWFHKLGSPKWFYGISGKLLPWLSLSAVLLIGTGLVWGLAFAPPDYQPRRPGVVRAEELRSQPFVSQQSDVDADIQSYFKKNDLHVSSRCYIVDDQSMIAMVACGQGLALMPELMFKEGAASAGCQVLQLEPAAKRTIGLACLSRTALSPAAREFVDHARAFARKR